MSKFEFKLPDIGEGVTEGEIVSWLVAVGDVVAEDQEMVEVMTDKATVTIGAPKAGRYRGAPRRRPETSSPWAGCSSYSNFPPEVPPRPSPRLVRRSLQPLQSAT